MKRAATNKIFSCGVFRGNFKKHKAVDMNAVLAHEARLFEKARCSCAGRQKAARAQRSALSDKETDDVLRFPPPEETAAERKERLQMEQEMRDAGEEPPPWPPVIELSVRTAMELVCTYVSGDSASAPIQ